MQELSYYWYLLGWLLQSKVALNATKFAVNAIEVSYMLCHRCESRAIAFETKSGPRYECSDFGTSKFSCYCYVPTKPVVVKRQKGDKRPLFANWQISARAEFVEVCNDMKLKVEDYKRKGKALMWVRPSSGSSPS